MEFTFVHSWIVMEYMCTSETAANLPVWTDRELIRIILHQKQKWDYSQGKLTVRVSFCLEGLLCWLKFLVV